MEITEVRITLRNEEKLKAFANVTFDGEFVVRGIKVINGNKGYFVSMPSRRRPDGSHHDIAHPINSAMRRKIEDKVLAMYEKELKAQAEQPPEEATAAPPVQPRPTGQLGGEWPGQILR